MPDTSSYDQQPGEHSRRGLKVTPELREAMHGRQERVNLARELAQQALQKHHNGRLFEEDIQPAASTSANVIPETPAIVSSESSSVPVSDEVAAARESLSNVFREMDNAA